MRANFLNTNFKLEKKTFQSRGNILRRTIGGGVEHAANREEQIARRDIRLTKIAITIVCVFVTCHVPRFVPNVIEIFTEKNEDLPSVSLLFTSFPLIRQHFDQNRN